jgi:hypothetical protein
MSMVFQMVLHALDRVDLLLFLLCVEGLLRVVRCSPKEELDG